MSATSVRACAGCGGPLPTSHGRRKWCSERCRRQTLYAGRCVDCGAPTNGSDGPGRAGERCLPCRARFQHESRRWTPEAIVAAIRAWAERTGGIPPSAREWLRPLGGEWPPVSVVQREFGSWSAAISAAGFSARRSGCYGRDGENMELCREIAERYAAGESTLALAEEYGCGRDAIGYRVRKTGTPLRSPADAARLRWDRKRALA